MCDCEGIAPQYVVFRIFDRKLLYKGDSADEVAELLDPGVCFGRGPTLEAAFESAMRYIEKFEASDEERKHAKKSLG